MKGIVEADDLVPVRIAVGIVIAARRLDRTLDRFGTGVGEEDGIGERVVDQLLRKAFA